MLSLLRVRMLWFDVGIKRHTTFVANLVCIL